MRTEVRLVVAGSGPLSPDSGWVRHNQGAYNWGAGPGRYTTSAITAMDANAKIQIAASTCTDLVFDIVGYYV